MEFIATLPSWVIAAVICAIIGGVTGLIGGLLVKRGWGWAKYLPIVAVAASVPILNGGVVDRIRSSAITEQSAAEMLVATSPSFYGFLRDEFPEDFASLTSEITSSLRGGGSGAEVARRSAEAVAQMRRQYAPAVAQAPDAAQEALIDSLIEFYTALNAEGSALCNSVAIDGPMVLIGRPEVARFVTMMEPQAVLAMQAAKGGLEQPTSRAAPTDADWNAVAEGMLARGATDAQLEVMATLDPSSPDLCPALLILMETLNGEDSDAVKSVRAQYVADVAGA